MSMSCNVVQDLIVLFQENTVSDETRREVRNHLKECRACRKVYREYAHLNQEELHFEPELRPEEDFGYGELAARIRKRKFWKHTVVTGAFAVCIGITVLVTRAILRNER
ncbi:MAG: zf-HC2 domain-containing protein [Lachnospiraceae bacterium]|nr:zf-HC2 domain-containing protein [Lachnospiraceae bacterium]